MNALTEIRIKEHDDISTYISVKDLEHFRKQTLNNKELKYLNVFNPSTEERYYVGACWLEEGIRPLIVEPKFRNVDYLAMFQYCISSELSEVINELPNLYHVAVEQQPIPYVSNNVNCILLVVQHFVSVVHRITQRGLLKRYVTTNQELQSKIKGKINLSLYSNNIIRGKSQYVPCQFQQYTEDCPQNQYLKQAHSLCLDYLNQNYIGSNTLINQYQRCGQIFSTISDTKNLSPPKTKSTQFFKEYETALRLAEIIIRNHEWSFSNKTNKVGTLPFYINTPKLFELYVYCKLYELYGNNLKYQFATRKDRPDFLFTSNSSTGFIGDAKYKPYGEKTPTENEGLSNRNISGDDIRQLAGYARNKKIRKELDTPNDHFTLDCLIIYPDEHADDTFTINQLLQIPIDGYVHLYKKGIKLPTIQQ
ncbi:MAG: hypothetical protein QM538_07370 [Methylacidiphilales bacterium]|nr:hypothetical protein [Candidatus Methylacidiphilales bacterium]